MHLLGLNHGICKLAHINTLEMHTLENQFPINLKNKHFSKTVAL